MVTERPKKDNHLIYADAVGSRGKSGVWFGEQKAFKEQQVKIMEALREKLDWVPMSEAILAISVDPPGICVVAPNPSLPGIIVLADGATPENTAEIRQRYISSVREAIETCGLTPDLEVADIENAENSK
jgi:hypothetical protein